MSAFSNDFGTTGGNITGKPAGFIWAESYYSKYVDDLFKSATSKAKAAARNEVNKSESSAFDPSSLTTTVGDTVKDPTTGEYTKEVTITQKKDSSTTPKPNDNILGMNKYVVIGGALAVVILGGFLVYELTKTNK